MKKKAKNPINRIIVVSIVLFLAAISISVYSYIGGFFYLSKNNLTSTYKIDIYIKTPTGIEKIAECTSTTPDFSCSQTYKRCDGSGEYYTNAVTYYNNAILSESGWQLAYKC